MTASVDLLGRQVEGDDDWYEKASDAIKALTEEKWTWHVDQWERPASPTPVAMLLPAPHMRINAGRGCPQFEWDAYTANQLRERDAQWQALLDGANRQLGFCASAAVRDTDALLRQVDALTRERDDLRNEVHDVRAAFDGSRAIITALRSAPTGARPLKEEQVESLEEVACNAVYHVGKANYQHRENEAIGWIRKAFEEVRAHGITGNPAADGVAR